jgi:hypothetical protein
MGSRDAGEGEVVKSYVNDVQIRRVLDGDFEYTVDVPLNYPVPGTDPQVRVVPKFDAIKDARLFADVWTVTGGFSTNAGANGGVPPRVAAESSRVLAAYLFTQGYSTDRVMRVLDVERATVHSFTSRVRADADEIRDELSE